MYSDSSDNTNSTRSASTTLTLGILWIIVYAKTNYDDFKILGNSHYYSLSEIMTWFFVAIWSSTLLIAIMVTVGSCYEDYCIGRWLIALSGATGVIFVFGGIAMFITQFVYLCLIMNDDPNHNFLGYKEFWSEGTLNWTNFESLNSTIHPSVAPSEHTMPSSKWPYEMADIIVRIQWAAGMVFLFILAVFGVCGGGAYLASKICN